MININFDNILSKIELIQKDIENLSRIDQDPWFIQQLKEIVGENFEIVWATRGAAIGSNWEGKDLIQTGNLKSSLTSTSRIKITKVGDLYFIDSDVEYAEFVNNKYKFYGVTEESKQKIINLFNLWLRTKGNYSWQ